MSINPAATTVSNAASAGGSGATSNKINPLLQTGGGKGEDHLSFWDVLDVINPLQHIPIVNNIYRAVTGDQISNFARVAGGALYGGFIGAGLGMANAVAVNETGGDIGEVAMDKMGIIKSQEIAQGGYKTDDAIAPTAAASQAIDLKNIPMVEVHPSQQAHKDEIIWDVPNKISSTTTMDDKVVASLDAKDQAAAMPAPKDLNDITTGNNAAPDIEAKPIANPTADPSVAKADVEKNMMEALNKYNAMQNASFSATGEIKNPTITNPAAVASNNAAPKNFFAGFAAAPGDVANAAASQNNQVKKPTAAFNKLRHYSN